MARNGKTAARISPIQIPLTIVAKLYILNIVGLLVTPLQSTYDWTVGYTGYWENVGKRK